MHLFSCNKNALCVSPLFMVILPIVLSLWQNTLLCHVYGKEGGLPNGSQERNRVKLSAHGAFEDTTLTIQHLSLYLIFIHFTVSS